MELDAAVVARYASGMRSLLLLLPLVAHAGPKVTVTAEPEPVPAADQPATVSTSHVAPIRTSLADGAVIDWTSLRVEVPAEAHSYGVAASWSAIEQEARRDAGPRMLTAARSVPITAELVVATLDSDPTLAEQLAGRISKWSTAEARYHTAGQVEIVAVLPLAELLAPWTLANAAPASSGPAPTGATGVLVDARGIPIAPTWSPRLVGPDGAELFDGRLAEEAATSGAPAAWVADPTDPAAAARAGERPLVVRAMPEAEGAGGDAVIIDAAGVVALSGPDAERALRTGHLVIVIDPQ